MIVGIDQELGRIWIPALARACSLPGHRTRRAVDGEFGIVVMKHHRPVRDAAGRIVRYELLAKDYTHNERVDAGASYQSRQVHGGGASPAAPSATAYFNVIAVASATLTKTKTDQSLGSASSGVTTNEFTGSGLARATADSPVGGDYTAPSSLGGTFTQTIRKTFTATASVTAKGAGVFNSTTVAGSILYVEDNFTDAVLLANDTLTVTWTITN